MRAVTIVDHQLEIREHPDPEPGAGQILVRVRAAGLNGADMLQVKGHYPPPAGVPADIPGMEFAGEVVANGAGARRFEVGDRVMSLCGGGAQAELVVVHEREAMRVPGGLSWAEAGGLPEAYTTAHDALIVQGGLRSGERLCVHGAAGGVGSAGVRLGVAAGARVTATVRSEAQRAGVAAWGATVVDPSASAEHGPYDVILELVGGPNLAGDLTSLATGGRILVIGVGAGNRTEIDLLALMGKRGRIHGSTLRARPLEEKAVAARRIEAEVLPLFERGDLGVAVHATFPLAEATAAYDAFRAGGKLGKIILEV